MVYRKHKILIIGFQKFNLSTEDYIIKSFDWNNIQKDINPKDYDTLLISTLNVQHEDVDWLIFSSFLNIKVSRDILFNKGQIIIVGDPRFDIPCGNLLAKHGKSSAFLSWTGLDLIWHEGSGDTIIKQNNPKSDYYRNYLNKLVKWTYSLEKATLAEDTETHTRGQIYERLNITPLAINRYKGILAFEAKITQEKQVWVDTYASTREIAFGNIIFLPTITLSEEETIRTILRDLCNINIAVNEPPWVLSVAPPGQDAIDNKINDVKINIDILEKELDNLNASRLQTRKYLALLYERELILEPIVWSALRSLGADVVEPIESNKEDGWISVKINDLIFEGVLEIKSTKKDHFTEDGRKQVVDWVQKGIAEKGKKYKGIFIGNSAVDKPFDNRCNPFPDSWKKAAELSDICAFTTTQLYEAYKLNCEGRLDRERFWKSIFQCNGICNFNGLLVNSHSN